MYHNRLQAYTMLDVWHMKRSYADGERIPDPYHEKTEKRMQDTCHVQGAY